MATEAKAGVVFVLDTKYEKGDKHFGALHRDMRAIAQGMVVGYTAVRCHTPPEPTELLV
jgi:hypothetical protein